jgi:serine/threonine-protein kinase RsbT
MPAEARIPVQRDEDIVAARQTGRALASKIGFSDTDLTLIATAISEIARNMIEHANGGEIEFELTRDAARSGLVVTAKDHGPGIPDLNRAMEDGFTTGRGLGLGLPGARRLMDDFSIDSQVGSGTTVVMKKWVSR